ncbi:hypothetical protein PPL_04212 [Heterostelium album PN500]|uniref:Glycosyltransferase 2-like domain-containing protein n=1 Tax=Heterostelium pallidum (strain ATCC 26659 / Pp 5 / PN500) TaxID=670386 RepID=D3B6Y1_HETP5|nr:hypothetical protein PPL_04212 [Heterostelium album PN500]EFA82524.1 hypothetical protein PPL_04212 [Heterostelium album PN500]|eukprot:XP_020434641.1 hypothetical protein PPL_04212 [Heterostelium album PN500]
MKNTNKLDARNQNKLRENETIEKIEKSEIKQLSSVLNKHHQPQLSIVIPVYNQIRFLDFTLQSLIKQQNTSDWEVIIVDDGSTEWLTKQLLYQVFQEYSQLIDLTILFEVNGGLSWARNQAIKVANGKWILPLDSDDTLAPDFLTKSFNVLNTLDSNNKHTVVISDLQGFVENEEEAGGVERLMSWSIPDWDRESLKFKNLLHCSALFRKDLWETVGGFDNNLWFGWEDWDFWLRLDRKLPDGLDIKVIREELFNYRMKPGMHSFCKDNFQLCFSMFQTLHPEEYSLSDIIHAHRRIGAEGAKILLPLKRRIKQFPNSYILHMWLGLVHEYHKPKDVVTARREYELSMTLGHEKNDWQPIILRILVDRGTDMFDESKRDLPHIFGKYDSNLKNELINVYGDIFK